MAHRMTHVQVSDRDPNTNGITVTQEGEILIDGRTDELKFTDSAGVVKTLATVDGAQTGSTLTSPVVGGSPTGSVLVAKTITFTEQGAGTYTGSVTIPAGGILYDIVVSQVALWNAGTSASLEVGNDGDPDGYFTAVDLKATDLLANESLSFMRDGGVNGADLAATHVIDRYSATSEVILATVVSAGAGTLGRTRVTVIYHIPAAADVVAAVFAA